MALSPQFLDELRARVGLVDTIARRVKLQRKGREHGGLCPFHSEKTPSFTVNEEKGFFHCFGCGAHGDVIGFVMRSEHLSFPEAIERLAAQAGLAVPKASREERARADKLKTLATALDAACAFYEEQLKAPAGREALDYLHRRGLDEVTMARFRLGWAPQGNLLKARLGRDGYGEAMLLEAGLLGRNDERNETYDYFRGRIMFPITDSRSRVVAFGGRVLGEGTPKYLNSRDGELFHKGRMLYGLAHARRAAAETGDLIVVEGYMDVIALHKAGFNIAVAPLGTALTEVQLGELWRLVDEPILCFDGDAAGQRAAARGAARALPLLKPGKSLRFVTLPPGEDPDSLIRDQGAGAMRGLIDQARPLVDLVWDIEAAPLPTDTPERRARLEQQIELVAGRIQDAKVRDKYLWALRRRSWDAMRTQGRPGRAALGRGDGGRGALAWRPLSSTVNAAILDRRPCQGLVAAIVNHPALLEEIDQMFLDLDLGAEELDKLRREILKTWTPDIDSEALKNHLKALGFDDILDRVLTQDVYTAARFARPEQALEVVAKGWRVGYLDLLRRRVLVEIEQARHEHAENMTEESLNRLRALRRQLDEIDAQRGEADEAGPDEVVLHQTRAG